MRTALAAALWIVLHLAAYLLVVIGSFQGAFTGLLDLPQAATVTFSIPLAAGAWRLALLPLHVSRHVATAGLVVALLLQVYVVTELASYEYRSTNAKRLAVAGTVLGTGFVAALLINNLSKVARPE